MRYAICFNNITPEVLEQNRYFTHQRWIKLRGIYQLNKQQPNKTQQQALPGDLDPGQLGAETSGTVITNFGAHVDIEGDQAPFRGTVVRCFKRGNMEHLVSGDRVVWQPAEASGVVISREPRRSELLRPDRRGKLRPVAANIDRIGVVFAPRPAPQSNLIDRYLVAAENHHITPFLVLNKTDLTTEENRAAIEQLVETYKFVGYQVICVSATTGEGVASLSNYLSQHTSILVGQSGVGKSSLINRLQPDNHSSVGALSESNDEGTHTTTASKLVHLDNGGMLIDTPGIREFGLNHLDPQSIIEGFVDFRPYLNQCKYRDCQHHKEPGCALLAAVEQGSVSPQRLHSYRQILESEINR
ncbi:MAG: small ribosomal subunit biogenesis GTPase RsgA [Porticoccaceae bacterium]